MAGLPKLPGKEDCHDRPPLPPRPLTPPPPLPPPLSSNHSFSPYLIFMFCGLSVSFVFICYLLFAARRRRQGSHENNNSDLESNDDFMMNEDHGPVLDHYPIWLINTVGLEKSQIESIQVFKYKKDQGLIEGTDCSVCLSEFEDDENLRLLPKCSHAFHVPCIDMWLSSHKNCPLCRAPIINPTTPQIVMTTDIVSNPIEPSRTEGEESETVDHHVIEIENNEEVAEKTCETSNGVRANSDLVDRNRVQGDGLVPMRRSVSMVESSVIIPDQERTIMSQLVMPKKPNTTTKSGHNLKQSSSSFRVCSKAMKSSSFGYSSRKASSSTIKCPHNRSY